MSTDHGATGFCTNHSQRGMGAEDYCTCDRPWPHLLAAEALDALRERIAAAMYDGNEAFHNALARERGQEYQRIERPSWADTNEYYRALYRARTDAALAAVAEAPGLEEVLAGHEWLPMSWTCECSREEMLASDHAAHLADVARAWLRGES